MDATEADRALGGNRALTTQELWVELHPALRRFCAVVVGPSDADDLAADTFLRCEKRLKQGDVVNRQGYLFRSAVRNAQNLRRTRVRDERRAARLAVHADSASATDSLAQVEYVRDAIRSLSPRQRAVLYLAYWEDQTEVQVAETLGLHVGTVRRHLHRAHQHLRKALR